MYHRLFLSRGENRSAQRRAFLKSVRCSGNGGSTGPLRTEKGTQPVVLSLSSTVRHEQPYVRGADLTLGRQLPIDRIGAACRAHRLSYKTG